MSLDLTRLGNVHDEGGKTIARCPACAERGIDETGEHLIIRSDGRFGCVVHPGPAGKPHRQRIAKLVGARGVPVIRVRVAADPPANNGVLLRQRIAPLLVRGANLVGCVSQLAGARTSVGSLGKNPSDANLLPQ